MYIDKTMYLFLKSLIIVILLMNNVVIKMLINDNNDKWNETIFDGYIISYKCEKKNID